MRVLKSAIAAVAAFSASSAFVCWVAWFTHPATWSAEGRMLAGLFVAGMTLSAFSFVREHKND